MTADNTDDIHVELQDLGKAVDNAIRKIDSLREENDYLKSSNRVQAAALDAYLEKKCNG